MPTSDLAASGRELGRARLVVVLLTVVAAAVTGLVLVRLGAGPLPDPEGCRAVVDGTRVELSLGQAQNAGVIAGVAVGRGLPARAVSIALVAAFQESKLHNLRYGDRDSVGLFQQRPSQGWGSRAQLLDPVYAAGAFYDALVQVEGYQDMPIAQAAQRVQRSGFPDAYAEHEPGARALASALTGWSPGRFSCVVRAAALPTQAPGSSGLTPRAESALADLRRVFGSPPVSVSAVDSGDGSASAHSRGGAMDIAVDPADPQSRRLGWAVAAYLVANADRLGIARVLFDGRSWTRGRPSEGGWQPLAAPTGAGSPAGSDAEHRGHVDVTVVG